MPASANAIFVLESSLSTGRTTTVANIQVLRVRDGKIQTSRDYHDHLRLAAITGRAEQLAAAMTRAITTD